jgi:hypothetical protein
VVAVKLPSKHMRQSASEIVVPLRSGREERLVVASVLAQLGGDRGALCAAEGAVPKPLGRGSCRISVWELAAPLAEAPNGFYDDGASRRGQETPHETTHSKDRTAAGRIDIARPFGGSHEAQYGPHLD